MRIQLIIPQETHRDFINRELCQSLHQNLSNLDGVELVDTSPEIVHIFGVWNNASAQKTESYRKKKIPVIFTPIKGLANLKLSDGATTNNISIRQAIKNIAKRGAVIHVCGKQENACIKGIARNAETAIIANSSFTATTDNQKMVSQFAKIYSSSYQANDNKIREGIRQQIKKIKGIKADTVSFCEHIMYIRQRYIMGNIPKSYIEETSKLIRTSDYDEKEIEKVLDGLKVASFAAYIMTLLEDTANLTEGFMPIEQKRGKIVKKMESIITQ